MYKIYRHVTLCYSYFSLNIRFFIFWGVESKTAINIQFSRQLLQTWKLSQPADLIGCMRSTKPSVLHAQTHTLSSALWLWYDRCDAWYRKLIPITREALFRKACCRNITDICCKIWYNKHWYSISVWLVLVRPQLHSVCNILLIHLFWE